MRWRIIRFVIPIVATGVMFMSQVGPKDAATNLGKWWELTALPIPEWVLAPRVDRLAFWAGATTLIAWSIWFFWVRLEPYAQTAWERSRRVVGYVDGRWTWEFQRPWRSVRTSATIRSKADTALDIWRERDRLEVYVIACRSVGVAPSLPVDRDPQNSRLRFLADAISDGRLPAASGDINGTGPGDGVMVQIRYSDLRTFARHENHDGLLRFVGEWSLPNSAAPSQPASAPETPSSNPHQEIDGPIAWEFGTRNSPIGSSRSAGAPLWVDAFQIKGQNISADPIHARKAAVRSDMTGHIVPLLFSHDGRLEEPTVVTIPPQGRFTLIGRIPPTDSSKSLGVVVDQFRQEFGAFTFTFEYGDPNFYYGDQATYTRRFPWAEVDRILASADVQSRLPSDRDIIIRKPPHYARTAPHYTKWDEQNVLRLFEAACLWNDEEPSLPMSEASLQTFWKFHKAIYEKRLGTKANLDDALKIGMAQTGWPREPNEDDPVNVNTKVSRQHLKPYAEKIGARPKFLYPDQRAGRQPV